MYCSNDNNDDNDNNNDNETDNNNEVDNGSNNYETEMTMMSMTIKQ